MVREQVVSEGAGGGAAQHGAWYKLVNNKHDSRREGSTTLWWELPHYRNT